MSNDKSNQIESSLTNANVIDFGAERGKRIHDLHDKRLSDMRQAFEQALPLPGAKKKRSKPKKKG
jgi:hypothetical protein